MELSLNITGTGKPLVLLHAFPLDHRMFKIAKLIGFQLILPDFPGVHSTEKIELDLNLEMVADALKRELDKILPSSERIVLGGISMGGYWAFEFFRKYPDKVSKLILISTRAGKDLPEAKNRRLAMAGKVEIDGVGYLPEVMLSGLLGATTHENRPHIVEAVKKMILMANPSSVAAAQRAMANRRDQTEQLSTISVPTLVIAGKEDRLITVSEAEWMAKTIPNCELKVIETAGHLIPLETPELFTKILSEFLN